MSWGWGASTATRIRPGTTTDAHGDDQPDWSNPDELPLIGLNFAPSENGDGGTIYAPYTADVVEGDHIQLAERRFEVMGKPQQWQPGTVVIVEDVDIPGQ